MVQNERPTFNGKDIQDLEATLKHIADKISRITWKFTQDRNGRDILVIDGLDNEPITLTHAKSAKAFLGGYLLGHQHGNDDQE